MARALVLGGYGLIGAACMQALANAGVQVTGLGRSAKKANRFQRYDWIIRDVTDIAAADWLPLLQGVDVVINASGALQSGAEDNLQAIHVTTIDRLAQAAAQAGIRIVHISAAGVSPIATTEFFRTKALGDALLAASLADHVILRPTLVLGREAYGGSALLRALGAIPIVMPRVFEDTPVQTVALDDLEQAVVKACDPKIPSGTIADITEDAVQSFDSLALEMRAWLGLPPPRWRPRLPKALLTLTAKGADALGWLGWRAPLRSTSIAVLSQDISGDARRWQTLTGQTCKPLAQTLSSSPATSQDITAARLYLALPLAIGTLALFWLLSGLIGFAQASSATKLLTDAGSSLPLATLTVIGGSLADITLGAAILVRRWTRPAALGMVALSTCYMFGAALLTPALYADPLGPLVKVIPAITLAALVAFLMDDR